MFQFHVTENIFNASVCRLLERHQRKGKCFRVPICSWKKSFGKCSGDFLCLLLLSSIILAWKPVDQHQVFGYHYSDMICDIPNNRTLFFQEICGGRFQTRFTVKPGSKPSSILAPGNYAVISDSELTRWHLVCFVLRLFLSKIERTASVVDTAAGPGKRQRVKD